MGASGSHKLKGYPVEDATSSGFPLEHLPEEVLIHILTFVPVKDLLVNLSRVCKAWKELIDTKSLWIEKCHRDGALLPWVILQEEIPVDLKKICVRKPFDRNLLLNWNAEDNLNHWDVTENGGDKLKVESEIPPGVNSLSEITDCDVKKCWVTSYYWSTKFQQVDLWKHGCSSEILNTLNPNIEVSEWVASRFDCSTQYEMRVRLLADDKKTVIKEFKTEREDDAGTPWTKVEHTFVNYGPGVRYVHFLHRGSDRQFWAGHYGVKMAAPCVKVTFPN